MVTQRRPPTPARPSRPRPSGPSAGGGAEPGRIDPELLQRRVGNLFSAGRAGRPAVRPDDLLALRIELSNLVVTPGDPPRLERASPSGAAALVVHLPPQSIAEETFFQTAPPGTSNPPPPKPGTPQASEPSGNEDPVAPPVRARIAGESRLAFSVPPGFSVPYTLEGVLQALTTLAPLVPANALPRSSARPGFQLADMFSARAARLSPAQRAALSSFALRSLRIAAVQQDAPTLLMRMAGGGPGLRRPTVAELQQLHPGLEVVLPRLRPKPGAPGARQTAIELPWHLILSPHADERWRHAVQPVVAPGGRTELWHTRLVAPRSGREIEPARPDSGRTLRAVWALPDQEGAGVPLTPDWPTTLPPPGDASFRMPLDDFDRYQLVHLSSNFAQTGYVPQPVDAHLLMLSALGGWLDSRGAWEPPLSTSVEEWVHRGAMGRDHFVRVVYKGFLFPFGHRVSLVKVSERKFHNGALKPGVDGPVVPFKEGNVAYLRQRLFIVVRERERQFADPQLRSNDDLVGLAQQFPFSSVRILTATTPDLDTPDSAASRIGTHGQRLFWPCVNAAPFAFDCVATDLDGRRVAFALPMIFMDNTLAAPAKPRSNPLQPDFAKAWAAAQAARQAWRDPARSERRRADTRRQRVALAPSAKPGDTSAEVESMLFDGFVDSAPNAGLQAYSQRLSRPLFYPALEEARVRIAALAQLGGSQASNRVRFNATYLEHGFGHKSASPAAPVVNKGQVFLDVQAEAGMATLDFSTQGDRSGGFVQPNLKPSGVSRLAGPVTGPVDAFVAGQLNGADAFPGGLSDLPMPLLFGCIPLGELIQLVTDLADTPQQIPKFASEGGNQVETFIAALARLYDFVTRLAADPASAAQAALDALCATLDGLLAQTASYAPTLMAEAQARLTQARAALGALRSGFDALGSASFDAALPDLSGLAGLQAGAQTAAAQLRGAADAAVGGVQLPSGLRQSLRQAAGAIDTLLGTLATLPALLAEGQALFDALDAVVGDPGGLGALLADPDELGSRLAAVDAAMAALEGTLGGFALLDGAPRAALLGAIGGVREVLAGIGDLTRLLELLTGDELTVRFDWQPPIDHWGLTGAQPPPADKALFRANDKRGFLVAVEAKVKKSGASAPKIQVVCSLRKFDLVLIAPASFIELNFDKIEFRVDSAAKMNVDVLLDDIKFVGPLSFVETLRDLIPLDGFSDPPYLDISAQGIDAGFDIALPAVSIGVFNLSNLSLGAGFTVPFIGQPLSVRFFFCTREQPFNLSVCMFGGGGFFGITLDPSGIQLLEASFEFGASISVDFGVASGGVHVMAGVYFRMEQSACSLTGYFRLGGHVSVLGLITASLELYLELRYEFESGKCVGKAQLTIEVEVFVFSGSVTISCEKKFAGSNGDPTLRDLLGLQPALPLADELALIDDATDYAWREYAEAFA